MTTAWASLAGMALFGVLAAFDEPIMRLLGREFAGGAPVLLILAAGALVSCAVGAVGQVLIMTDRPWAVARDNLMVTALVAVGLPLVAPVGGVTAAAAVMAVSLAGVNLVRAWRVWREHGIIPWDGPTARLWVGFGVGLMVIAVLRGALPGTTGRVMALALFLATVVTAAWPVLFEADERAAGG
jgi:O-antigen/teichoic acid export membrane protein